MDERKSTVSKTVMPVGQSTRELFERLLELDEDYEFLLPNQVLGILADTDARDPYAVGNLLYAWRTGQLA
jgi:hypothetical protein